MECAFLILFPRLNERGSIEAGSAMQDPAITAKAFPRLNERGSIEAARDTLC